MALRHVWIVLLLAAVVAAVLYLAFRLFKPVKASLKEEAELEAKLLAALAKGPLSAEEAAAALGAEVGAVAYALGKLAREGYVKAVGEGRYALRHGVGREG